MYITELHLKEEDNNECIIQASDILGFHAYNESEVIKIDEHMSFAGSLIQYFLIKTKTGDLKIPRSGENDTEILNFILHNFECRKKR